MTGNLPPDKRPKGWRPRGFRSAGAVARPNLSPVAARHGFAEPDVLMRWQEIVGEGLSDLCQPVKVSYQKGSDLGATLLVQATGALGPEIEMKAPQMLERINAFYGYRAISRLKVTQSTGTAGKQLGFAETALTFQGKSSNVGPDGATLRRAEAMTSDVSNAKLREALKQMAAHVLSKPMAKKR